jgi:hypothetical protein
MVWSMVVIPVLGFFLGIASKGRSENVSYFLIYGGLTVGAGSFIWGYILPYFFKK